MSIMLPGIVADALDILGFTWPNLDEDKIRDHARAWKTFAADVEYVIADTDRAAKKVAEDNHGESVNTFTGHWAGVGGQGDLREAADAANLVGDALEIFADIVVGLKTAVIAEASATAALIVGTAGAALLARGALTALLRKLKKEAIEEILSRVVPKISQEAMERFARILKNPLPNVFGRRPALAGVPDNVADRAPNPNIMAMLGRGGRGGGKPRTKTDRLKEHLTDRDLDAARRELNGEVVKRKSSGKPWDHVDEVRNAQRGLLERIKKIKRQLSDSRLSDTDRTALESELSEASRLLDRSEQFVPRPP